MNQIRIKEEDSGCEEREEESAIEKVMIGKVEVSKATTTRVTEWCRGPSSPR